MTPEEKIEHEDELAAEFEIFIIFFLLFIGQLIHQFTHKFHIPYTPALTVFGLIIGALDRAFIQSEIETKEELI